MVGGVEAVFEVGLATFNTYALAALAVGQRVQLFDGMEQQSRANACTE
jgi:hypothetical protein